MRDAHAWSALTLAVLIAGCSGGGTAEVTGAVSGYSLTPSAQWWGGPFLVITSEPLDCIDMYWVKRSMVNGDEAPVDKDLVALQFTYNEGDVIAGTYSVEGAATVIADLLVIEGGALQVFDARTGALVVDEIEEEGFATGSFDLGFDDGTLSGSFDIEFCNNMKTKD